MKRGKRAGLLLRLLLLALIVYGVFSLVTLQQKIVDAREEAATLTQQVADQKQTNTALENAIENRDNPSFIMDVAREKLGLVAPYDRIFYITD